MRPPLRTTLARDDRAPRVIAAFAMLIGVYLVVHAMGLDPVPALASRLSGEARGSVVVAAAPRDRAAIQPRPVQLKPSTRERAATVAPAARAARPKPAGTRTRTRPVERTPEAQNSPRDVAPVVAPTAAPKRPDAKSDAPQTASPTPAPAPPAPAVPDPGTIVPPPPHLPSPPTVPLPDPTTLVDPGTLPPPVTVPGEPPLPNLPLLP
jgi:hypothetical protein